jgi:hypothetical protein
MSDDIVARLKGCRPAGPALDAIAKIKRLRAHVEALQQKVDADKSCACAYDSPDDVCLPHSPVGARLRAEVYDALRLMEPVAFSLHSEGRFVIDVELWDEISAFVKRMKGE